jgi:hypothetical protein
MDYLHPKSNRPKLLNEEIRDFIFDIQNYYLSLIEEEICFITSCLNQSCRLSEPRPLNKCFSE